MGLLVIAALIATGLLVASTASAKSSKPGTAPPKPHEPAATPSVVTALQAGKAYVLNVYAMKGQTPGGLVTAISLATQGTLTMAPTAVLVKSDLDIGGGVMGDQWLLQALAARPLSLPFNVPNSPWQIMSAVDTSQLPPKVAAAAPPGTSVAPAVAPSTSGVG